MSKWRIGNYDTGEPKFMYFRVHKHYAQRARRTGKLRWKLFVAKHWAEEVQWEKRYTGSESFRTPPMTLAQRQANLEAFSKYRSESAGFPGKPSPEAQYGLLNDNL